MNSVKLYIENHHYYSGISDLVEALTSIFKDQGWDVSTSRELCAKSVNIVIEEMSHPEFVKYLQKFKRTYPNSILILLATEFITTKDVPTFNNFRNVNLWEKIFLANSLIPLAYRFRLPKRIIKGKRRTSHLVKSVVSFRMAYRFRLLKFRLLKRIIKGKTRTSHLVKLVVSFRKSLRKLSLVVALVKDTLAHFFSFVGRALAKNFRGLRVLKTFGFPLVKNTISIIKIFVPKFVLDLSDTKIELSHYEVVMRGRYYFFAKSIGLWDGYITTHSAINPKMSELVGNSCVFLGTLSPKAPLLVKRKNWKKTILSTGRTTVYRGVILDVIKKIFKRHDYLVSSVGFASDVAQKEDACATINISQSEHWPYSSPNRIHRSLKNNLFPIVWEEKKQHPIDEVGISLQTFLQFADGNLNELVKKTNKEIEKYNLLAQQSSIQMSESLKTLANRSTASESRCFETKTLRPFKQPPIVYLEHNSHRIYHYRDAYYGVEVEKLPTKSVIFTDEYFKRVEAKKITGEKNIDQVYPTPRLKKTFLYIDIIEYQELYLGIPKILGSLDVDTLMQDGDVLSHISHTSITELEKKIEADPITFILESADLILGESWLKKYKDLPIKIFEHSIGISILFYDGAYIAIGGIAPEKKIEKLDNASVSALVQSSSFKTLYKKLEENPASIHNYTFKLLTGRDYPASSCKFVENVFGYMDICYLQPSYIALDRRKISNIYYSNGQLIEPKVSLTDNILQNISLKKLKNELIEGLLV